MTRGLLILIFCLFGLRCFSQNVDQIYFEHHSPDKGLSQGSGYTSVQFDDFMWFGTQDGLNRFDGYDFKVYKSGQINASFTQTILNDKKGHLWVGTSKGLNIYDPRTDSFQKFNQFLGKEHLLQNVSVRNLMMDKGQNIWILTDGDGAFYFDSNKKTVKNYPEFSNHLVDVSESNDSNVFVATDEDVYLLANDRQKFLSLKIKELLGLSPKTTFRSVLADKQGRIWIGTYENGLFLLEKNGNTFVLKQHFGKGNAPANLSSNEITRMMQDSKGNIWIGTRTGGISLYNPVNQNFTHILHQENEPLSLSGNYVLSFSEDRQNNIWVGMSGSGFEKYDPRKYRFGLLRKDEKAQTASLPDNMIFKMYGQDNYIYIGTQSGGLARFDPSTNQYKVYQSNLNSPTSLLHNEVYDISADKSGNLWLALGKGLCRFSPKTQRFESYFREGQDALVYLKAAKVLSNDEVWTGGDRGLFRYSIKENKWKNWDDLPAIKAVSKYNIRLIFEDSEGDIWLGTIGQGLLKYSPKTKKLERFEQIHGVDCANIRTVFEDGDTFWFGSDCGAYEFSKKKKAILRQFTDTNGLPNNVVYGILKDRKGRLWFSTNQGLANYDPAKKTFTYYNASDGLQANEFNTNCTFLAKDGTMYFGGVRGISFFKPESLTPNEFVAPVKITSIKVMDEAYTDSLSIPYVKDINLPFNQNFLSFEFAAFNFSNSEKNSYRYKMDGLEEHWTNAGNKRSANYTNLSPGNYTFRVKGFNNDGRENVSEAKIKIHISPPFWKTVWFIGLLVLIFLGVVYAIYRNKIKSIRNEERQKADIKRIRTQAETSILRAQLNPDFIFNSLNAIEAYSLTNRRREASQYIQNFSKLIRMVLENSREDLVPVEDDIQTLKLFVQLEEERYGNVFHTEFEIDPLLQGSKNQIPPLLIQPFVENAISNNFGNLETNTGILKIVLKPDKNLLKVIIQGTGTECDSKMNDPRNAVISKSIGWTVTQKRVEALGNLYESRTSSKIVDTEMGFHIELFLPLLPPI